MWELVCRGFVYSSTVSRVHFLEEMVWPGDAMMRSKNRLMMETTYLCFQVQEEQVAVKGTVDGDEPRVSGHARFFFK